MGKWTVGEGDDQMLIKPTGDGRISVSIPSGKPIVIDPGTAEEMRLTLGSAIGIATGDTTT